MQKTRTFISVPAAPAVCDRAAEAIRLLRQDDDGVKWVDRHAMHWTLQFLGDLTDADIAEVCFRVQDAVAGFAPFPLVCRGLGAFPAPDRPKTLWLGAATGGPELCALQAEVESSLDDLGFRTDRRQYRPHLTLGRIGRGAPPAALKEAVSALEDYDGGEMIVDEVAVMASRLHREGPAHTVLATAPLDG
ncbi:MAG: RNA 2',3'-cyclic phosphodiesterase [Planctomycetota bacterium]